MSETVSWDEDVLLADGHLLPVHRTVTYGPDEWGRSGRGRLKEQTIRFSRDGQKIKWENNDLWPIVYMPDVLDYVNGMPVLVMPVHRWGPCNKYDFPQEGLVAFGYQNGRWDRIAIANLPKELKVNLLRSTHAIQYWDAYKDKRITPSDKQELERSGWGSTKQGQSISEASKFYANYEDSCARIRPLPNPQLDALKQINNAVEQNAKIITASLVSVNTSPEKVSQEDFAKSKGTWTGNGYLNESCKGIVTTIEALREYFDQGSWHLVGFQLNLANDKKIPLRQTNLAKFQAPAVLQLVTCEKNAIYTIKRENKENLVIHRFTYSGESLDASRVFLPGTDKITGNKWGDIWSMTQLNDQITIVLADYTYTGTANQGGTINQKQTYVFKLPR